MCLIVLIVEMSFSQCGCVRLSPSVQCVVSLFSLVILVHSCSNLPILGCDMHAPEKLVRLGMLHHVDLMRELLVIADYHPCQIRATVKPIHTRAYST